MRILDGEVFPARAGMSLIGAGRRVGMRGFPRPRGDEPCDEDSDECGNWFSGSSELSVGDRVLSGGCG